MTSEFFHVETNAKLNQSTKYKFSTSISKKYLPSNNFSAEEILNPEGNYYNTRHVFKLKPDYFDKPDLLVKVEELKEKGKKFNVDVESIEEAEREYSNGLELAKSPSKNMLQITEKMALKKTFESWSVTKSIKFFFRRKRIFHLHLMLIDYHQALRQMWRS